MRLDHHPALDTRALLPFLAARAVPGVEEVVDGVGMAGRPFGEHLPGVGPWTAAYVSLRSGDDDAFLPTDLGVRHGLAALGADPRQALDLAEAWRPFRAFAVAHLWATAAG